MHTQLKQNAAAQINWGEKKDDELLSASAKGGDEGRQAFEAFYRRHTDYLFGTCYDLTNRYKFGFFDHEDVFQLTMIKALESAETFKSDGFVDAQELEDKADAWLGEIAKNVTFDLIRRRPTCVSLDPALLNDDEDPFEVPEIIHCEETTEIKLIREAIETLSENEKSVLWAASQFYQRRTHQRTPTKELDEIIKSLGISKDNFRKIRERARKKIRQYLAVNNSTPPQNEASRQIQIE